MRLLRKGLSTRHRAGMALITSIVVLFVLSGIAVSALVVSMSQRSEISSSAGRTRAFYIAEAGLNESLFELTACRSAGQPAPATVGTRDQPRTLKNGRFFCDVVDNGDGTFTVTSTGLADFKRSTVQAVVSAPLGSAFDHAVFAGNRSGDPDYELGFGGDGVQADDITGNIYSGGDVEVTGDATVAGTVDAVGTIVGVPGNEGVPHPPPDIAGMDYESNHDYDVAALFAAGGIQRSNALGGLAWEMPEASPAHIFRKNPDDRLAEINGTAKDDYFLEDPYMPVKDFTVPSTGKEGHTITLTGNKNQPGPNGTNKVYYIDGNLWVHNKPFGRLRFKHDAPGHARVTFVVKGNIYFSDDVYIHNRNQDGVAFIAINDDAEADSGNIYLGDPRYGTLDTMEAFMYAENNFYDNNLDETGSSTVTIVGNMTAGNHVAINRDFVAADGSVEHSKLTVTFDDRVAEGRIELPGLPGVDETLGGFTVVFWRRLETP